MDFSPATWWWVAAGVVVAAELATGTLYLLMIGLGLAAGAAAAYAGLSGSSQLVAAAAVGCGATAVWHWRRRGQPGAAVSTHNRDVNLDIGERVRVAAWAKDGTAQVQYRGSIWSARLQPGAREQPGEHVVAAVEGNWLVLAPSSL